MKDKIRNFSLDIVAMMRRHGQTDERTGLPLLLTYHLLLGMAAYLGSMFIFWLLPNGSRLVAAIIATIVVMAIAHLFSGVRQFRASLEITRTLMQVDDGNSGENKQLATAVAFWLIGIFPTCIFLLMLTANPVWIIPVFALAPMTSEFIDAKEFEFQNEYWISIAPVAIIALATYKYYDNSACLLTGIIALATAFILPMVIKRFNQTDIRGENAIFAMRFCTAAIILILQAL